MLIYHKKPLSKAYSQVSQDQPLELFRVYKVFPANTPNLPPGKNTQTLVLSQENQAYSTWTAANKPSEAKFIIWIDSRRWFLEHSINVLANGSRLSPSDFREHLYKLGYKDTPTITEKTIKAIKPSFLGSALKATKPKQKDHRVLNPEIWAPEVLFRNKAKHKQPTALEKEQAHLAAIEKEIANLIESKKLRDSQKKIRPL